MATYVLYEQINSLEEFAMIAGTDYTLTFTVYDEGNVLQNIGGAQVQWTLSPYGQSYNVLQIAGVVLDDYSFSVTISASDTEEFSGKYTQQITIESFYGQQYRPAQGIILILPRTPLN